jgi:hypothetical protein
MQKYRIRTARRALASSFGAGSIAQSKWTGCRLAITANGYAKRAGHTATGALAHPTTGGSSNRPLRTPERPAENADWPRNQTSEFAFIQAMISST